MPKENIDHVPCLIARNASTDGEQLRSLRTVYDPKLDRLLARHPNAPADLLAELSHSADKSTRRYVARHATTPKDILLHLAPQFPSDFLRNPVVDWLLIEAPDLLQNLGQGVLKNVLKRADCPDALVGWAARHGSLEQQLAATMNPAASPEVLRSLALVKGSVGQSARAHVRYPKSVRLAKGTSRAFVEEIRAGLRSLDVDHALALWRTGFIGPAQWSFLSVRCRAAVVGLIFPMSDRMEPDSTKCRELAKSTSVTVELLCQLAKHPDLYVRRNIASNPKTPVAVLTALAKERSKWSWSSDVVEAVAKNPNTPASLLMSLLKHSDWSVREAAEHRSQDPSSVEQAAHAQSHARANRWTAVASDPQSDPKLLAELARRNSIVLRWTLAGNPSTPEEVRRELISYLWLLLGFDALPLAARGVASSLRSRVRLITAARHWWHKTRLLAGRHGYARMPARISDDDLIEQYQRELACFSKDPQETLAAQIMGVAGRNLLHLNAGKIEKALKVSLDESGTSKRRLVGVPRLLALAHANAPVDALVKAHRSVEWLERMAVARNLGLPTKLAAALKNDANRFVAKQAAETVLLQQQLRQWGEGVMKVSDRWQQMLISASHGASAWDGFSGETSQLIGKISHHTQALKCVAVNVSDSPESPHRAALAIARRLRAEGLSERMWSDPVWSRFDEMGDLWEWLSAQGNSRSNAFLALRGGLTPAHWQRMWGLGAASDQLRLRAWIACSPLCPPEVLNSMVDDASVEVRVALCNNASTSDETRGQVLNALTEVAGPERQIVAENPQTPAVVLEVISHCDDVSVRLALALNPSTPSSCLERLARDAEAEVRWRVAKNQAVPTSALMLLSSDVALKVRQAVVSNANASEDVLNAMSTDVDADVRAALACRADASLGMLGLLVKDPAKRVRRAVAGNPVTPLHMLQQLACDRDDSIRCVVAENPGCSPDILEALARSRDGQVLCAVANNPSTPTTVLARVLKKLAIRRSYWDIVFVASHPAVPSEVLKTLIQRLGTRGSIAEAVASNPATPMPILEDLAKDRSKKTSMRLACRVDLSLQLVEVLARDKEPQVRSQIAGMETLPPSLFAVLAKDRSPQVRLALAGNPRAESQFVQVLLETLAREVDRETRTAVALHPAISAETLETLVNDDDREVRNAARGRLESELGKSATALNAQQSLDLTMAMRHALTRADLSFSAMDDALSSITDDDLRRALVWLDLVPRRPSARSLTTAAGSNDWLTRLAVALHPLASAAHLKRLSEGTFSEVVAAAQTPRSIERSAQR